MSFETARKFLDHNAGTLQCPAGSGGDVHQRYESGCFDAQKVNPVSMLTINPHSLCRHRTLEFSQVLLREDCAFSKPFHFLIHPFHIF